MSPRPLINPHFRISHPCTSPVYEGARAGIPRSGLVNVAFVFVWLCAELPCAWSRPLIIAHRGGRAHWPENTVEAFEQATAAGVDAIEMDVQVTRDGVPVLYHPRDLSSHTDGEGKIATYTHAQLRRWRIPTLLHALRVTKRLPIVVDMKSLPALRLVNALLQHIPQHDWSRLVFYSTNADHLALLKARQPKAVTFEPRWRTRRRILVQIATGACTLGTTQRWIGFEARRTLSVVEQLTLGPQRDTLDVLTWRKDTMACARKMAPRATVVFFGVNDGAAYRRAAALDADAVLTDAPLLLLTERQKKAGRPK